MATPDIPKHTVRYGMREGAEAASVEVTRTYDGTVDEIWEAMTDPERLARWFSPVSGDLAKGGRFQIEGNASGTVTECHPPRGYGVTWEFAGATSWVDVEIAELTPSRTVVRIAHTATTDNDHWRQFGPAAVGLGWDLAVEGLSMYLAAGGSDVSADGMAWMMSQDGADYLGRCGEGWYDADVRAGAQESEARQRADASVTAFTTPPEPN